LLYTVKSTGNAWLARIRAKSGCTWFISTFRSTRVTTDGTISTGVRRSSYHRLPKARVASNDAESQWGKSSGATSSIDKPAGISISM
jgi:hypothetical protein